MISLSNLFEDIQQPPQQPGQPVQQSVQPTQQQMVNTGQQPGQQQPDNQQNPGLWNKIKSGYDNINNKYESAVNATKNALFSPAALQTVGMAGMALMPFSPTAGVVGMGAMQASRALSTARLSQQLVNNARMQYQNNRQQYQTR